MLFLLAYIKNVYFSYSSLMLNLLLASLAAQEISIAKQQELFKLF